MTSSINSTLDNFIYSNMLSDTAAERINETFSKSNKVKETDTKTDEKTAASSEADDKEDVENTSKSDENNKPNIFEYNNEDASIQIGNYIKKYTDAISNFLTYKSENKVPLDESPLKDVLKNKFKTNIAKSAYNDVGMGEYYNLKKILNYSQALNSDNTSNISKNDIIKNITNFTISV